MQGQRADVRGQEMSGITMHDVKDAKNNFFKKNSNKRMCYVIEFSLLAKRMLLSLCMAM